MSRAFIAEVIQESTELPYREAYRIAGDLVGAIVKKLKTGEKFTPPSFGTFTVRKTKARNRRNTHTGEPVKVKPGKKVRFKASPALKKGV